MADASWLLFHDREWGEASCRNVIGHRWTEKTVHPAALQRQVARPVLTDIENRLLGIDEWKIDE